MMHGPNAGDFIGRDVRLPQLHSNDHIVVHDAGAYTIGMFSRYNSRPCPGVIGVEADDRGRVRVHPWKAEETIDDILRMWG